jgi:hypothetical protein
VDTVTAIPSEKTTMQPRPPVTTAGKDDCEGVAS